MRLLLTSAGISNVSIRDALTSLIGRPFGEARIVVVTTAATAQPGHQDWLMADLTRLYALGWAEFNLLEINGLPKHLVVERLRRADVIYVEGGNVYHLARSLVDADLADDVRELLGEKVYVGASAGSMIFTRDLAARMVAMYGTADELFQAAGGRSVSPLNLFDWWIQPHVNGASAQPAGSGDVDFPLYAIDDQTAIRVIDDRIDVISEGTWKLVGRPDAAP